MIRQEAIPLCELADTLFFASLGREEGQPARVHIVYDPEGVRGVEAIHEAEEYGSEWRQRAWEAIAIEPISFTAKALIKLTPAANLERTAVIVGPHDNQGLHILGLARRIKDTDGGDLLVFSAPEPGCIVLSFAGEECFRYERGKYIPPTHTFPLRQALEDYDGLIHRALKCSCKSLIARLPEPDFLSPPSLRRITQAMRHLIQNMVSTRHGGLIAILPPTDAKDAQTRPVYQVSDDSDDYQTILEKKLQALIEADKSWHKELWAGPPKTNEKVLEEGYAQVEKNDAENSLTSTIESIGHLTAIDNALLLGPDLTILGAGYPIPTQSEEAPMVREARDLQGENTEEYDLDQHGSRHRAAAMFADQNPGGLAFVVSQDGPLRCMLRPEARKEVLLWNIRLPVI